MGGVLAPRGPDPQRILPDAAPPTLVQLTERFSREGEEELLETLLTVPVKDIIDRHFESDEIKAMVSTGALDMGDISAPGSGDDRRSIFTVPLDLNRMED